MTPLAVNPSNTTYLQRVPYLTTDEYVAAPTAVDTSQLVPGGNAAANTAALAAVIARASSWIDEICCQVLAATSDTESGIYRVRRDGYVILVTKRFPILEVDAISIGVVASQLAPLDTNDAANIWIDGQRIFVPVSLMPAPGVWAPSAIAPGNRLFVVFTYVNGFPNTTVAVAANAATVPTTVTVSSALGIYAGSQLNIYDGANTELVTVTSVAGNVVTVPALAHSHAVGVSVSGLPPAVKQAAISLTSCLIKTRGTQAIAMASIDDQPSKKEKLESGGGEDEDIARDLLIPFTRVV